ncbi:hypothetical protein [Brumimicrobium mesophilum]|uniref:hypothetical protein n=1 Tax=Brumimicrobium mesophilum TaxID=392717 RepID=UPI000D144928|nr:hypothetical protein [Brumimicrobium mesophilum]
MMKPLFKILIGILVLFIFIYTGIPFEVQNPKIESIFRILSFTLIFFLLFTLFKQVKKLNHSLLKFTTYVTLGLLSLLFIFGAIWNNIIVFEKNERNSWNNMQIYTNEKGTKIIRQIRETSGSIYDYRDRLVIFEFDKNNRISINTNLKDHRETWTIEDGKNN